ncbi:MAG: two-component regulator propeller domain-containing protein [Rhodothermales bacterium]
MPIIRAVLIALPLVILVSFLGTGSSHAQSSDGSSGFVHRSWTVEDGLPQNTVTAIARTVDGYMWFGTEKGVVRFDGSRFVSYESATTPGLGGDRVTTMLAASSGDLWIGTEWGGLTRYSNGKFTAYLPEGAVPEPYIVSLYEDSKGAVWVGVEGAVYRYFGQEFERFDFGTTGSSERPLSFLERASGQLVASGPGLRAFTGSRFDSFDVPGLESKPIVFDMREAGDGSLWLATAAGMVHSSDGSARLYLTGEDPPVTLDLGQDGVVWAGVRGKGLMRFDGVDSWSKELSLGYIRDLLFDDQGLLWIAGGDDGLHRLQPALFHSLTNAGVPAGESVLRVAQSKDGAIWTGSLYAGILRYRDGVIRQFTTEDGLPGKSATVIAMDANGDIWSRSGSWLFRFDGQRFQGIDVGQDINPYGATSITALEGSATGGLWLGMPGAVARFDQDRLSGIVPIPQYRAVHPGHLHEDSKGNLWVSADRGVLCRITGGQSTCFDQSNGVPPFVIRDVHENMDGTEWFGTYGGGLCRLADERVRCIGPAEGLADNTVHEIFDDAYGFVWFSSNRGVSRVRRSELEGVFAGTRPRVEPDTYGPADGMPSSECNEGGLQASDGTLWFPTVRGLTFVDPKDALSYRLGVARAYVEGLVADGSNVELSGDATLPPGSNRLSFEFTGIYFSAPDKLRFRSRLNGYDEDWVTTGSQRSATYTGLAPGTYSFDVQAAVGSGDWSPSATLNVRIAPFYYETLWFRLMAAILVLGLLGVAYRRRVGRLLMHERLKHSEAETRRLAELDAAKSRFFANVSHEFRTPLTLIMSPVNDALEKGGLSLDDERRYRLIMSNARRLLRLINQLLDLSKLDAGRFRIEMKAGDFSSLVEQLVQSFQPLAERNAVSLGFRTQVAGRLARFDANVITGIVNNLISNALKFTPSGGKVWISLAERGEDRVELVVKDTGPGIPRNALARIFDRFEQVDEIVGTDVFGTGIGLALAKELTELHGGVLLVESEEGFGSAFIVRLPLARPVGRDADIREVERPILLPEEGSLGTGWAIDKEEEAAAGPTVLVVDDNEDVRALVVDLLGPGFRIVHASDGQEGFETALQHQPQLVVSDVMMPRLDGIGLCRKIRSEPRLRHIPIVLLTAKADDDSAIEGLAAGADDYIVKPFHGATLRAKARNLIDSRRLMRDQFSQELVLGGTDIVLSSDDRQFAERLFSAVDSNLSLSSFNVTVLADEMGLSRRQLTRRSKAVFGLAPSHLILNRRLEIAAKMLTNKVASISEIAYQVGFRSPSHFGSAFRKAYGHPPGEHVKSGT